ncbi:hypothetical protein FSP39_008304 [Pinctada imbricata]|uniref:G-protein coupled receptors family 1 profile domain-containing protein n=1 Tax=Pinctada imbricata TaxID=66713 RepID=A0AA89BP01_PINIB|nr:hypothetical protein FSP39_008304 [Pinctada imbricata]
MTLSKAMEDSMCDDKDITHVHTRPLLETDLHMAMIYIVIMAVALLIGVCGNAMILVVSTCVRGINKIGKEFIINLALADLCVTAVADPMCIVGVVKGEMFFDDKFILCQVIASMCLTACFCAFMSLTMVTMNRYIYLCHNEIYDKLYKRSSCIIMCCLCWIIAFFCEFPNFIGWGGHYFDIKNHQCIWDRTASYSYTLFVAGALIGGPLLLMGICYFLIFKKIWETKRDVYMLEKDNPKRGQLAWNETVKASRTLFVIFVVFVVCWTPYAVLIAFDVENTLSVEVHLFVTLLAHLHSSCNCVIYIVFNRKFRTKLAKLLGCWRRDGSTGKTDSTSKTKTEVHQIFSSVSEKVSSSEPVCKGFVSSNARNTL